MERRREKGTEMEKMTTQIENGPHKIGKYRGIHIVNNNNSSVSTLLLHTGNNIS